MSAKRRMPQAPLPSAYRIVRRGYPSFDGSGAARRGGRWNSPGREAIYAPQTYALAVLENLVHFNMSELPPNLVFIEITIPPSVSQEFVDRADVKGWDRPVPNRISERFGDRWLEEKRSAVLWVPSMLSPHERNALIHPHHRDTSRIEVNEPKPLDLDGRLVALLSGRRYQ